ncbi:MAG: NAD(P)-dependent dehydrogenase (short-subunit alcohol dehydrogenase family) [Arenicella sp.]|jgi:NAD(P)-dependent dehydrogenase (short-subunit alcohol dehydrogenase family)
MSDYKGKTAVISGGAEGIGLGIALAMGQQGMNLVLGDIDEVQLVEAQAKLEAQGIEVLTVKMDVTDPAQWRLLGEQALQRFGKVHMLVNNAGVASAPGPIEKTNHKDWNWVIDVNLKGVIYGAEAIVPLIKEHGEGGWVINVASMAGMIGVPYAGAYTATKVAVVGMSEAWNVELAKHNIDVSVLCPAFVKTRIHLSHRNRQQEHFDEQRKVDPDAEPKHNAAQEFVENGIAAELVGQRVVEALNAKELYIFTHPAQREVVQQRSKAIDEAFERAQNSPLLAEVTEQSPMIFD